MRVWKKYIYKENIHSGVQMDWVSRNEGEIIMVKKSIEAYLEEANGKNIKLELEQMAALMEALDWPDEQLKIIHVTGTNGKGSVCEMLSSILQNGGYKVGVYSSPYFEKPNECIQINHEMISDEVLMMYINQLKPILEQLEQENLMPSGFEILTAMALLYFRDMKVDFVILEVGLGGRLDATNIIKKSCLSIITKVAMDHMNFLGNSLSEIAREKAGIIKSDSLVLTSLQGEQVMNMIKKCCAKQKAELNLVNFSEIHDVKVTECKTIFTYQKEIYELSVSGKYQAYNASIAISAIQLLRQKGLVNLEDKEVKAGLRKISWPGRFEKVKENPLCFIDGAHNVDGMMALAETLQQLPRRKTIAIIGILRDKEIEQMLKIISPQIDVFIVTKPLNPRAAEVEELATKIKEYAKEVYVEPVIEKALEKALKLSYKQDNIQIIGFGSLYMIGYLRSLFLKVE